MTARWSLTFALPIATAALMFVAALALTLLGLFALEQRESAIREDIATAFLDTLAGVLEPVNDDAADAEELRRVLVSAGAFKAALRNQGVVYCCIDGSIIAATDAARFSDAAETNELITRFMRDQAGTGDDGAIKRLIPELEKFIITKSYQTVSGDAFQLGAAFDLNQVYEAQRATRRNAILIDLAFAALAALAVYFLVRTSLRPLEKLTQSLTNPASQPVAPQNLAGERTEVGRLQRVLNTRIAEQAQREALQEMERDRARDAVLARLAASVAHEVRNPLAGMSAAVSTLKRFGEDDKVRAQSTDLLERGLASIDRVAATMLSTYRQEDGERDLTPADLADLELLARPKMARKHITLDFEAALDAPFPASANPIRQIILNLLLNAAEAADEGGHVHFRAALDGEVLQLNVSDDGPGMPAEALAVVTQAQENDVPQSGRLGLWLIHKLLDDIDARLTINTKSGKGTHVSITVPPRGQEVQT
ncbi:MAG: HAMP domain-containing sensor histidine kinase [Pseudomonadota bacterium]